MEIDINRKLPEGTKISFSDKIISGEGNIVGIAMESMPIIGYLYIVKYSKLNVESIYSTICVYECHITQIIDL